MTLLIKNGLLVDPCAFQPAAADLLIKDGIIQGTGFGLAAERAEIIDASGMLIFPGFIDLHTHLREPGREDEETIATGTAAAVRGGFTAVCAMPNTTPACDNPGVVELILKKAAEAGLARVYPVGCITKGRKGEEMAELWEMASAGAVAFSDDGSGVNNARVMRYALQYGSMIGKPFMLHCEDAILAGDGVMHEGYYSTILGLKGIPALAEEIMVQRDIQLAKSTGTPIHICHVSSGESARLIRKAKEEGVPVTAEVTPHHLVLTDEILLGYDTKAKVNPPLRSAEDMHILREYLAGGIIDAIATDHAPHAPEEKNLEFDAAPFGLIGLETAAGLIWTELVTPGFLSPNRMAAALSAKPASIIKAGGGSLEPGAPADIAIFDPERRWTVEKEGLVSKSKNSPFIGRNLTGKIVCTIVNGKVCYRNGIPRGKDGQN
ncbi:MAG: dihydroorotase [Bacillota bacterium]